MQTIIRKSVFETNSSSCHSLCIKKIDSSNIAMPTDVHLDKEGVLTFELGCYGFGSYNLPSFNKKFSYLMTYLLMCINKNVVEDLELVFNVVHEIIPFKKAMLFSEKLKDDMWEMQKLTIASFDETTNKIQINLDNLKVIKDNFQFYDYYIDHESIGLLSPILFDLRNNDSSSLKRLLFVNESYIHIDDDNKENIRYADGGFDEVKTQMNKLFKSFNPSWNADALMNLFGKKDLTYLFLDLHSMWKVNNKEAFNCLSNKIISVVYDDYDLYTNDYYEEKEQRTYEQCLFKFIEQLLQKPLKQEDIDFLTNDKRIVSFVAGNKESCQIDFFKTDFGKYLDKQFIQMVKDEKRRFNEYCYHKNSYPFPFQTSEYGELALKTNIDDQTTNLSKQERESDAVRVCYKKWLKSLMDSDGIFNDYLIMDYLVWQNVNKQFDIQKWIDECNYQYFR